MGTGVHQNLDVGPALENGELRLLRIALSKD